MLDNGEAQPGAATFTRAATVNSIEAFGQARDVFGLDADAAVLHRKHTLPVANDPAQRDNTAVWRVTYRIADEITERAAQLIRASQQLCVGIEAQDDKMASGAQRLRLVI